MKIYPPSKGTMRKFLFVIFCFIIGLGIGKVYLSKTATLTQKAEPTTAPETQTVDLKIDYGNSQIVEFEAVEARREISALDVLEKVAQENNFDLVTEETSFGKFIKGINKVEGDAAHFWAFLINGEMSNVGADSYIVKNGDKIEFVFTKMQ